MDTLQYLRRGRRVGAAQALLAWTLRIKPLIHIPTDQSTCSRWGVPIPDPEPCATWWITWPGVGDRPVHVAVQQGGSRPEEEVEWLTQAVRERFDCRELYQMGITPVIGTHTGPGTLALSFWVE